MRWIYNFIYSHSYTLFSNLYNSFISSSITLYFLDTVESSWLLFGPSSLGFGVRITYLYVYYFYMWVYLSFWLIFSFFFSFSWLVWSKGKHFCFGAHPWPITILQNSPRIRFGYVSMRYEVEVILKHWPLTSEEMRHYSVNRSD